MRVGSLFTGYGGLDLAVGGDLAWYAEIEPAACKVLAHHYPGVPNLGDVTTINWLEVEPVDVITGGYPCQPFSYAGNRKGKKDVRHLWPHVLDAIRAIRPRYAIMENVSGHLTLGFADVLNNLAEVGWSAEWGTYRASDVGAPHRRERLFIIAYADSEGLQGHDNRGGETPITGHGHDQQGTGSLTPDTSGSGSQGRSDQDGDNTEARGQRPSESARGSGEQVDWRSVTNGDTDGRDVGEIEKVQAVGAESSGVCGVDWGQYAPAIRRWESVLDRPAPAPTVERKDKRRLNPQFVEWMMGLPDGWVTGHGLSAAQELKMLGNGVVPQQARLALTLMDAA